MGKKVVNIKQNTNDIVQSLKTQLWLKYRTIIKGKRGTHGVKIVYCLSTAWEDNEESNQVNADKKDVWVLTRKVGWKWWRVHVSQLLWSLGVQGQPGHL